MAEEISGLLPLSEHEFKLIADLVYSKYGINLTNKKKALVRGRLNKLIKSLGYQSFKEYYEAVTSDKSGRSLITLIDRISTNHTYFYREADHFDFLVNQVLPDWLLHLKKEGTNQIRLWCAGCATGEEPYTLAILFDQYFRNNPGGWGLGLLATDISLAALKQAQEGIYTDERMNRLPMGYKRLYFKPVGQGQSQVKPFLKANILFKKLNLMQPTYPFQKKFDIVFIRNVMIYFDQKTRHSVVEKIARYMKPGGWLFIGHSESLGRDCQGFRYIKPAVYRRV